MARFEIAGIESGALGATMGADVFFELGMMYSTGRSVPTDLVTAHKWFNIAAMRGNKEAIRCAARSPPKCRRPTSPPPSALPATGSRAAPTRRNCGPPDRPAARPPCPPMP